MTVMAIGMMAVFGTLWMTNDVIDQSRDEAEARLLAERHMVSLLVRPAGDLNSACGTEGRFNWEEKVQATKVPNVARIIVTVRWRSCGRPASFELVSLRETD